MLIRIVNNRNKFSESGWKLFKRLLQYSTSRKYSRRQTIKSCTRSKREHGYSTRGRQNNYSRSSPNTWKITNTYLAEISNRTSTILSKKLNRLKECFPTLSGKSKSLIRIILLIKKIFSHLLKSMLFMESNKAKPNRATLHKYFKLILYFQVKMFLKYSSILLN